MSRQFIRFDDDVREVLLRAGWHPGRNVVDKLKFAKGIPLFPAAKEIHAEFGGIRLGAVEINNRKEQLGRTRITVIPNWLGDWDREIVPFEPHVGTHLYPGGNVDLSQGVCLIDEKGRIWLDFGENLLPLAFTFDEFLTMCVRGAFCENEDIWMDWGMRQIPRSSK